MENGSHVAVKVEDVSPVKKRLSFDVPWTDVKERLDAVYRDISRKAKIRGFRPGKVPRPVLERQYGKHAAEEAASQLVASCFEQALRDKGIIPVARPEIDQPVIEAQKDFAFSVSVEVEPVIEPEDYLGLDVEKTEYVIAEEDMTERLDRIREMYATLEDAPDGRTAGQGDFVTLDFTGSLEGEPVPEMSAEQHLLEIGSGRFFPGFEDQIVGMAKGETKRIDVRVPEGYHAKRIAGKDVSFTVTVRNLQQKVLPALDEHFIKNFERYETLDDLKADVRRHLEGEMAELSQATLRRQITDRLLEKNPFEAPPSYVERQIFLMMADAHQRMTSGGMEERNAAELSVRLHDRFKDDADRAVRSAMLLREIARKEALSVDEAEVEARIREMAGQHARPYEDFRRLLEKEDRMDSIRRDLLQDKAIRFVQDRANVKTVQKNRREAREDVDSHGG